MLDRMFAGDRLALSRLITLVENDDPVVTDIMERVYPKTGRCYSIGITGPPGAGKSTLADKLIAIFRSKGLTTAVIAVDPSSPFSGGAVLGDRIRMQRHSLDDGVFIRSLGTRGSHGGLSRATRAIIRLFDAFGMDVVILETVGVGQTELDVVDIADTTIVVLVPESGDTIQTMKAGLMEIADVFVVNKADREGADRVVSDLTVMVQMARGDGTSWSVPVLMSRAHQNVGIEEIYNALLSHQAFCRQNGDIDKQKYDLRLIETMDILVDTIRKRLEALAEQDTSFKQYLAQVARGTMNPYEAAKEILKNEDLKRHLLNLS